MTLSVVAVIAIMAGTFGLLYHYQWFGLIGTIFGNLWWLLMLWLLSTGALVTFITFSRSGNFFTKEVTVNFDDFSNSLEENDQERQRADEDEGNEHAVKLHGTYLSPFVAQLILRPILSIWITTFLMSVVFLGFTLVQMTVPTWLFAITTIVITILIWWPNQAPFYGHTPDQASDGQPTHRYMHIPNDYVGIITWLGNRLPFYLTEGDQPWLPTILGFGVNRASLYGAKVQKNTPVGEADGLVYVGIYILPIWNSASDKEMIAIENVTRGGSTVTSTFLVSFVITRPLIFAKTTDPVLRIADQARAGLRKAFAYFRDIDVTSLKSVISSLTEGKTVRVALTTQTIEHLPEGSVVTNRVGDLFANLASNEEPYDSDEHLMSHIKQHGHPRFFTNRDSENGESLFGATELSLREKLAPTIRATGGRIVGTVIGNISLSAEVSRAAQEAEAVGQRRLETMGLAQAQKDARVLLRPEEGEETDETTRIIALMQSGVKGVKLVHTTGGGGDLTRAAATHASLTNNEEE